MIVESVERPDTQVVAGFRDLLRYDSVTCAISDCMGRFNAMTSDMRPLFDGIRLTGTAITVKTLGIDEVFKKVFAYQTRALERNR